jgi:hypothetical protein
MDGLFRSVGNGISGLVEGSFQVIGDTLRGMVDAGNRALPGGVFLLVAFVIVVIVGWNLAKR